MFIYSCECLAFASFSLSAGIIPTLYIHTPTDCGCDALMVYVGEQSPESGERGCVRVWVLVWGEWSVTMWVVLFVGFVCC